MLVFVEQITKEFFFTFIAALTGIWSFRYLDLFWRLAFYQLLAYILVFAPGYGITIYQQEHGIIQNNQWLYNILMFIETAFLYKMATLLFNKNMTFLFFAVFLLVYMLSIFNNGIEVYANYAYVTAGIFITVIYSFILYYLFNDDDKINSLPKIYLCIGLVVYFACIIPYFSMLSYLNKNHATLSRTLFHIIADILANIRYLCLAIGFWLVRRNALNPVKPAHEQ